MRAILGATLALTLLAISFAIDFTQTTRNGAVDLRNRITGVRLLEHGIDPYHYIWHPGDPAEFCDLRNNPRMTVSKTTATPAMLVFYAPLAAMPYRAAQFAWLYAQWLLLLGTGWLWLRVSTTPLQRWLVIFFLVGFTFTPGWRWEAERGQFYTLLTFLFALWLSVTREAGRATIAGFLAGLLIALRPPFAMLLPFIALSRRGQLPGALAGLIVGIGAPMLLHGQALVWLEYASAMQTNADYYLHASLPPRPAQAFPEVIEGTPSALLASMVYSYPTVDVTIYALARRLGFAFLPSGPVILGFGVLFLCWVWWRRRSSPAQWLPGLTAWVFLTDLVLPTTRWGYYDVCFLNVAFAVIVMTRGLPRTVVPALLALPVFWSFAAVAKVPLVLLYLPQAFFACTAILCLLEREKSEP